MFEVTVIDVNQNGTATVRLDDGEYFDNVPVSNQDLQMGERILMSPEQITAGYVIGENAYNGEGEKPTIDW